MTEPHVEIVHPFTACARQFQALNGEVEHVVGFLGKIENLDTKTDLVATYTAMAAKIAPLALCHVEDFVGRLSVEGDEVDVSAWIDLPLTESAQKFLAYDFTQVEKAHGLLTSRERDAWVVLSWLTCFTNLSDEDGLRNVARDRLVRLIEKSKPRSPAPTA